MIFWLIASALTFLACLALLLPFLRAAVVPEARGAHDLEVYRDQLAELERDASRGLIRDDEALQARAEIGRRILALDAGAATSSSLNKGRRLGRIAATAGVLSVPLVSWGIYAAIGSPAVPDQPLSVRLDRSPAQSTAEELIARAEAHLRQNPEDGRGWDLLAPIYLRLARYDDAIAAYQNAIRIEGTSASREGGLAEATVRAGGGVVTAEAEAGFQRALAIDARDGRAMFFLALAKQQEAKTEESAAMLRRMISELPREDGWHRAAEDALARVTGQQPGPSEQDVAAAANMSPDQRAGMIESMVQTLDHRLRSQPDDLEGWQRLVQSYVVLGRREDAADALRRALDHFEGKPEAATLVAFSTSLGLGSGELQ